MQANKTLKIIGKNTILVICSFIIFCVGFLCAFLFVFAQKAERYTYYQISYADSHGKTLIFYARGEETGLLGQHEAIIFSPENPSRKAWSYKPNRDLRFYGTNCISYKIKNDSLFINSPIALPTSDLLGWKIPIIIESKPISEGDYITLSIY